MPKKPAKKPAAKKRPARRSGGGKQALPKKAKGRSQQGESIDRRRGSELQAFMDLVMTNLINQYHYGLLQQAHEQGYREGLEAGMKEGIEASGGKQAEVSVHDLKHFVQTVEGEGLGDDGLPI